MITHAREVAKYADRVIVVSDGKVVEDKRKSEFPALFSAVRSP
jgi:ABC-type lipoprotein export system ATPase subunit